MGVKEQRDKNRFPELNSARKELMNFYSNVAEEEANWVYKGRGGISNGTHERRLKAYRKNLNLMESPTMVARKRYRGYAYKEIPWMGRGSAEGEPDNVLIMSALMGLIHPDDFIPDYELMMKDSSPDVGTSSGRSTTVSRFWQERTKGFEPQLSEAYPDLEFIYCFMSRTTGYVDAVKPLLSGYNSYAVSTNRRGVRKITTLWGEGVRRCAPALVEPTEVESELERIGCSLHRQRL